MIGDFSFANKDNSELSLSNDEIEFLEINNKNEHYSSSSVANSIEENTKIQYFNFDPNSIGISDWKKLGFSHKQAEAIVSYRTKKGGFKKKEDLKKVFVISEKKYAELEPFIQISSVINEIKIAKKTNLNLADADELQALPGIGPKTAENILKRRSALGGFTSVTQLHEVYGITEDLYQIIIEKFTIESEGLVQIKINSATKEEIDKHPYITWSMTASILKKRDQQKIDNLDFLLENGIVNADEIVKVLPYINFE